MTDRGNSPKAFQAEYGDPLIPPDARRTLLVYNLLFPIVFALLFPSFLLRMMRRGNYQEKLVQRLGYYSSAEHERFRSRRWIWIQSISVGETFIALKLAHALHEQLPDVGILLSTTTSTGFAEARKAACDWLEPIYNPIDVKRIVRRALDALQPAQLILIEGGVWPNLVAECRRREIPMSLANARLSPRSERRFRKFRGWTGPIFRLLDRICVPDPEDLQRWESLGAPSERIVRTGSIKFDNPAVTSSREAEFRSLLEPLGIDRETPIVVGGSTWAPEEHALAAALPMLRETAPGCVLILVPRHVERTPEILRSLASLNLNVIRRSMLPLHLPTHVDVLLVDATGELRDWYALASVVFVGKSLPGVAAVGGQNPAEPAVLGKAVVFGPHMENFAILVKGLLQHQAAEQVSDADSLACMLRALLADPGQRQSLGLHARQVLGPHAGATDRTATLIARHEKETCK